MNVAHLVKSQVDIVHVIGDHVQLKKQGGDRWKGLCPFHSEKTPSFSVHQGHQFFKCFGCGKGGDVFTFVMEVEGLTFGEALRKIADSHNIVLPALEQGQQGDRQSQDRAQLYRMHELAQEMFRRQLRGTDGAAARAYLERRQISEEHIERFGLGLALRGNRLTGAFARQEIDKRLYPLSGLVGVSDEDGSTYDRFRSRLTFPIGDRSGRVVGFGARALEDGQQPKYLNSPETELYNKSQILYNFHRARAAMRRSGRAVLVEGYMDVIGAARAGVEEVVAVCGTNLTPEQARMIRGQVPKVVVNFDGDNAGQSAVERHVDRLIEEGLQVHVLELPGGLDPDEYCREQGNQAYVTQLERAPSFYTWLAARARKLFDLGQAEGRVSALRYLLPAVQRLPTKLERATVADELAHSLGIERGMVLEQFRRGASDRDDSQLTSPAPTLRPGEKLLVALLANDPEARHALLAEVVSAVEQQNFAIQPIVDAIKAAAEDGEFDITAVQSRLGETERELLTRIVFDPGDYKPTLEDGRRALSALLAENWESKLRELRNEAAAAERAGEMEKALQLLQAKREIEQRMSQGRKANGFAD